MTAEPARGLCFGTRMGAGGPAPSTSSWSVRGKPFSRPRRGAPVRRIDETAGCPRASPSQGPSGVVGGTGLARRIWVVFRDSEETVELLGYRHEPVRNALSGSDKPLYLRSGARGVFQRVRGPLHRNDCRVQGKKKNLTCAQPKACNNCPKVAFASPNMRIVFGFA